MISTPNPRESDLAIANGREQFAHHISRKPRRVTGTEKQQITFDISERCLDAGKRSGIVPLVCYHWQANRTVV